MNQLIEHFAQSFPTHRDVITCRMLEGKSNRVNFINSDPTSTLVLRRNFIIDFRKRFRILKDLIQESIVKNDCFGLSNELDLLSFILPTKKISLIDPDSPLIFPIAKNRFKFRTTSEKLSGFMQWLNDMEDKILFEVTKQPLVPATVQNKIWTNEFIQRAYLKGMRWGRFQIKRELKTERLPYEDIKTDSGDVLSDFLKDQRRLDRAATIYHRVFTDLVGIDATMDAQISRLLAEGLAFGFSPRKIAKNIVDRVDKVGVYRATILARTEVIRAHHLAAINEYREYGIERVKIKAEWTTAGDSRVCPDCASLDFKATGKLFSLEEIEPMIPLHPQCRCAAIPVVVEQEI